MRAYLGLAKQKITTYLFRHGTRLVDLEWYCTYTPLTGIAKHFSLLHYWLLGARSTSHCHPLFDSQYFIEQCQHANLPIPQKPLKTYLGNRRYWHINPHPLFDASFYQQQVSDNLQQAPLLHYINGGYLQYEPHPLFQHDWYFISFPALKKLQLHCPLVHYMKIGYTTLASTHPLFHAEFYAKQAGIPVVDGKADINTLAHFVTSKSSSISCHPLFDSVFFRKNIQEQNTDKTVFNLICSDYLHNKEHWTINTHPLFDTRYYLLQTTREKTNQAPLTEYIAHHFSSLNPHPLFNTNWYQNRKKNILEFSGQGCVPLTHFVLHGHRMGESPHPLFALQWYRHTYLQGRLDQANPLIEFLMQGETQGNRPNPLYPTDWRVLIKEKYDCATLCEFIEKNPITLPALRNRISDAFYTHYLDEDRIPSKNYLILFTPRSGSSWLTDLISQQKILGKPSEWFNPDLIQSSMNALGNRTHNIYEYCQSLQKTHQSESGFFGAELTATHLAMLEELLDVDRTFNSPQYVILLRKNIIAQGISLFLATETGFFHATNTINSDNQASYDENKIKKWIGVILDDENYFYRFINNKPHTPLLIWYEDIQKSTKDCLSLLVEKVTGANKVFAIDHKESQHRKISSKINQQYEDKFRKENIEFVKNIASQREFLPLPPERQSP